MQQQIVSDLLAMFPHLTDDDVRSTSMGAGGEDIQLSATARRAIPFSIEAKNQERVNVWNALEQCRSNAPKDVDPIVVFKKNGEKPHVLVSWECFKRLIPAKSTTNQVDDPKASLLALADQLQRLAAQMDAAP